MTSVITDNIDIWTSAVVTKKSVGRGSSKKQEAYGIKKLRELILELAVRGKLVSQDPNDESARMLLEKVSEEKEDLVKEGKLKKQKALPEFDMNDLSFDLPSGWEVAFIPQVIKYDKYAIKRGPFGSAIKKSYFVSSGYKVYEQQHAINDDFSLGDYYINEEKFSELEAFKVMPNDIIISCSGTVGKVSIAPTWMQPGIINQALLKLSLNQNILLNEYFKILFPAFYLQTETLTDLKGTAQKNMVSVDTLKKEPFPLPPLSEQKRIVTKVDELMALCDKLEQEQEQNSATHQILVETLLDTLTDVETAEEFSQSWQHIAEHFDVLFTTEKSIDKLQETILQLAVMGKLVPQDPSDEAASVLLEKIAEEKERLINKGKIKRQVKLLKVTNNEKSFKLKEGWEWTKLGNLSANIHYGYTASAIPNRSGVRLLRITDIQNDSVDWDMVPSCDIEDNKVSNYLLEDNDILIARTGGTIGKSYLVKDIDVKAVFASYLIRIQKIEVMYPPYIKIFLKSPFYWQQLYDNSQGTGQPNVNATALKNLVFPIAPIEEQYRIVKKVDELMALCDTLRSAVKELQATQINLADTVAKQLVE